MRAYALPSLVAGIPHPARHPPACPASSNPSPMKTRLTHRHLRQAKSIFGNPVATAVLRSQAMAQLERMRTDANIHTIMGADAQRIINIAARVMYCALGAAIAAGCSGEEVDLRIIRGAASAAADASAAPEQLEQHRQAILSGLQATDRLWPALHPRELTLAYARLEQQLASGRHLGTEDFEFINPNNKR
jgi:hypothetical protein